MSRRRPPRGLKETLRTKTPWPAKHCLFGDVDTDGNVDCIGCATRVLKDSQTPQPSRRTISYNGWPLRESRVSRDPDTGAATVSSGLHPTLSQNRTRLSMTPMKKTSTYLLLILSICRTPAAEAAGSPATKILACSSSLPAIDTTGRSDGQDFTGRLCRSSICVSSIVHSSLSEMTQVTLASCRSCRIALSRRLQAVSLRSASTVGASSTPEWNHVRMIVWSCDGAERMISALASRTSL